MLGLLCMSHVWLRFQLAHVLAGSNHSMTGLCCPHCSERSQSESRLRSQLEASNRKGERFGDDVRALTATKCELESEVGVNLTEFLDALEFLLFCCSAVQQHVCTRILQRLMCACFAMFGNRCCSASTPVLFSCST